MQSQLCFDNFFSDFEILNKEETYLSWPSFQVENDLETEFLAAKGAAQ